MSDLGTTDEPPRTFVLREGVQIYYNGADELRLRKGVWNFEEAILTFDGLGAEHKETLVGVFRLLQEGAPVDGARLPGGAQLTQAEREQVSETLEALRAQAYVSEGDDSAARQFLAEILGGAAEYATGGTSSDKPALLVADSRSVTDYAVTLAQEIELPMTVMSSEDFKLISAMDVTTKFDAYETERDLHTLRERLTPFGPILVCLERPHIVFLRNLNRALVQTSQVLCLGMLDGPFTTVATLKPPETGCFECFEQRLLARMEEMTPYREFVAQTAGLPTSDTKVRASPLMHPLAAQVLMEGLMVHHVGKAKLAGRVLNTYVPLLEMQVQPLLRVPFCPACGFIAQGRMDEMYSSSKKIMDRIVDRVTLVDPNSTQALADQ